MSRAQHLELITGNSVAAEFLHSEPSTMLLFTFCFLLIVFVIIMFLFLADKEGNLSFDSYDAFKEGIVTSLKHYLPKK